MEAHKTFSLHALTIDAGSKSISSTEPSLTPDLDDLNQLNRALLTLDSPNQIPPPPPQVNHQKRSVNITKLRERGNGSYKKGAYTDAVKFYDLACGSNTSSSGSTCVRFEPYLTRA